MDILHPSLWRTCRTLANPVRLRVLRHICGSGEACVSETARACHLPLSSTTAALRALQARGLLSIRREGLFVIYYASPDTSVEHAAPVLAAVRGAFQRRESAERITRSATAFTHVRRILIVRALAAGPATAHALSVACGISRQALYRHLDKLARRGLVEAGKRDVWRLTLPEAPLLRDLHALVISGCAVGKP